MGFVFPQNFDRPYRALTFREFWRRWHMTLSRFLRDFLYIPLGGNRGGKLKTARNLMLTMVLGGLWHGAAWGFVLWGFIHGSALVIENVFRERMKWSLPSWAKWAITFHIVVLALDPVPRAGPEPCRRLHLAPGRLGPGDAVDVPRRVRRRARHRPAAAAHTGRWTRSACATRTCIPRRSARAWRSSSCS